jgi:hypothetical protein
VRAGGPTADTARYGGGTAATSYRIEGERLGAKSSARFTPGAFALLAQSKPAG